jgi:site-specific DNA recombinase
MTKQIRAAFYARYSSEQQREASIDDQFRNLERRAEQEGWRVVARFADKALSGKRADRPEFQGMLAAATRKEFDVLLVDDLTRFSRDGVDLELASEELEQCGVRVVALDGYDSAAEDPELKRAVHGVSNAITNKDHSRRTRRGQEGKALAGYWVGGRPYGYALDPIYGSKRDVHGRPERDGTKLKIDAKQAKIVREIYTLFADGQSERGIASALNTRSVASPGSSWAGRKTRRNNGWQGSAVRVLLRNELYTGQVIWKRSEWKWVRVGKGKRRIRKERPRSEWRVRDDASLRIVPAALWDRVARRLQARKADRSPVKSQHRTGGNSKYLLSGLLRCGSCGAHFVMSSKTQYACGSYVGGGTDACKNTYRVNREHLEAVLLATLRKQLLEPKMVEQMVRELAAEHDKRLAKVAENAREIPKDLQDLDERLTLLRLKLKNEDDAAFTSEELVEVIKKVEQKRLELLHAQRPARAKVDARRLYSALPEVARRYEKQITRGLQGDPPEAAKARELLRELVGGVIKLSPTKRGLVAQSLLHKAVLVRDGSVGSGGRI